MTRMMMASALSPSRNEARLAIRRMETSGFKNRPSNSRTLRPRLPDVGSFRPYFERRADASSEERPCDTFGAAGDCPTPSMEEPLMLCSIVPTSMPEGRIGVRGYVPHFLVRKVLPQSPLESVICVTYLPEGLPYIEDAEGPT